MATYQIKKGDTLSAIASQYGTDVSTLAQANGIANPNKIYAGQSLNIPDAPSNTATASESLSISSGHGGSAPQFQTSPDTDRARAELEEIKANKPAEYQERYQDQIENVLSQIENRGSFSYDPKNDQLYQQYADSYTRQGRQAMRDTMANAATLSGGYGNSYAATAGQMAYDEYLSRLNDRLPELYNLALSSWNTESQRLENMLSDYRGLESDNYGRYRDTVSDWQNERDFAADWYSQNWNEDYKVSETERDQFNQDRDYNLSYQKYLDSQAKASSSGSGGSKETTTTDKKETTTNNKGTMTANEALTDALQNHVNPTKYIDYALQTGAMSVKEAALAKTFLQSANGSLTGATMLSTTQKKK